MGGDVVWIFARGRIERGGGALGEYIKKIKDRSKRRKRERKKGKSTPHPITSCGGHIREWNNPPAASRSS
jgi:hypothetical protein